MASLMARLERQAERVASAIVGAAPHRDRHAADLANLVADLLTALDQTTTRAVSGAS